MLLLPIEPRVLYVEHARRNTEASAMFVLARCQLLLEEVEQLTQFCLLSPESKAASWLGGQIVEWTQRLDMVQREAKRCLFH